MNRNFGGIIWTNHAMERMRQRGIKQGDAWATWHNPQQTRKAATQGAWIYYRTYGSEKIEVVVSKNDKGEWVVLSVWSRPVYKPHQLYNTGSKTWDNFLERILIKLLGWMKK